MGTKRVGQCRWKPRAGKEVGTRRSPAPWQTLAWCGDQQASPFVEEEPILKLFSLHIVQKGTCSLNQEHIVNFIACWREQKYTGWGSKPQLEVQFHPRAPHRPNPSAQEPDDRDGNCALRAGREDVTGQRRGLRSRFRAIP